MHNIRTFLEYEEVIPEDWAGDEPPKEIESIEFKNVGFCYKEGDYVIRNLSFRMDKGQSIALVGHNGRESPPSSNSFSACTTQRREKCWSMEGT